MAPEQIEGHRGDQRTDIYALGTMLFEMLTGATPFSGDNNLAVMAQHLKGGIPRLDKAQPGVSLQLAAFVARCLQREPEDRFSDMHALLDGLDHLDSIDVSILDRVTERKSHFWHSPTFIAVGSALLLLTAIVILAFILQALHK